MGILYDFIFSLWYIVNTLVTIYIFIIIASALISWVNPDPYNPIVRFLRMATEPVLAPIRRLLPRRLQMMGLDLSPLIAILVIVFIQTFVSRLLMRLH